MIEVWKPIKDYEGLYEVSNTGKVRSLDRKVRNRGGYALKRGKIISDASVGGGRYRKVGLWKNNMGTNFLVHRLVAAAFVDNPDNLPEVNHKDENPENNCASNLEWCERVYNMRYGTAPERRAEKLRGKPTGSQPILQYSKDGEFIASFPSALKAAEALNADNSAICRCANGKVKTSYGYVWQWAQ